MSRRRAARAAVVSGGHVVPLCPEIAEVLGLEGALIYQQLLFLHHGREGLHDWMPLRLTASDFKVPGLMSDDTLARKIAKVISQGAIERGEKRGRRSLYRVRPQKLQELVAEQFPDFVAYDPWVSCGIGNPQPADKPLGVERAEGQSLFTRTREEAEAEVEQEQEPDKDNTLASSSFHSSSADGGGAAGVPVAREAASEDEEGDYVPDDAQSPLVGDPVGEAPPDNSGSEEAWVSIEAEIAALKKVKHWS